MRMPTTKQTVPAMAAATMGALSPATVRLPTRFISLIVLVPVQLSGHSGDRYLGTHPAGPVRDRAEL